MSETFPYTGYEALIWLTEIELQAGVRRAEKLQLWILEAEREHG